MALGHIDVLGGESPMAASLAEAGLRWLEAARRHQRIPAGRTRGSGFNPAVIAVEPILNRPPIF